LGVDCLIRDETNFCAGSIFTVRLRFRQARTLTAATFGQHCSFAPSCG